MVTTMEPVKLLDTFFKKIYAEAHTAGVNAVKKLKGSSIDTSLNGYVLISLYSAKKKSSNWDSRITTKFSKWLVKNEKFSVYYDGVRRFVDVELCQHSVTLGEAYAAAFVRVLRKNNIGATWSAMID